jgi:hypothetical protein
MKKLILFLSCILTIFLHSEELVDVVYTWVDGSDAAWLEQKNYYLMLENPEFLPADAHAAVRFTDRDELKYSLRSIWQFAPWVHHVYIVTAGQKPAWLKDHPFITIVDHREIFRDLDFLPTFNSQAIEANLHHISDLEEAYIYFNDDVFLGHPVERTTFFTKNGNPKISFSGSMPTGPVAKKDRSWLAANKNATRLLTGIYGQNVWKRPDHTAVSCKKSAVMAIEAQIPDAFESVSSHRFRSLADYAMTNGLIPHMSIQKGEAEIEKTDCEFLECGAVPEKDKKTLTSLSKKKPTSFCIQDNGTNPLSLQYLTEFFEEYFPNPAPWEKEVTAE